MVAPQLLTSLPPQPVISLSSPQLHFPTSTQFVGAQPQVIPVQPHQVILGGQPLLPQQPQQQKYKVIQVVVPTRIADQVLNTQQKYQLLPAPPEAQAATMDGARVGPPMPVQPGFITPAPLPPPPRPQQQVVQVQPQFQHAQVQLAAGQPLPPGAAILLPAAATAATPFPM